VVARVEALEQRDVVVKRELKAVVPALHRPAQPGGQACDEILVALVDEPVLIAHRKRIRDPHPDILVSADRLVGPAVDLRELARQPALKVLHGGDPGCDHLEGGIKRVEIEVQVAHHHAGDEPQLERHVGRAELHRRQADMMVAIDKARQQYLVAAADHRQGGVLAAQLCVPADLDDDAVLLQHCSIRHLVPAVTVQRMRDHRAAANERCGH